MLPGGGPSCRVVRMIKELHDRRGQGGGIVGRDEEHVVRLQQCRQPADRSGDHGSTGRQRLMDSERASFPAARDDNQVGGMEQFGNGRAIGDVPEPADVELVPCCLTVERIAVRPVAGNDQQGLRGSEFLGKNPPIPARSISVTP